MAPRLRSELLLLGSLPAETTESALRIGAEFFGDLVFALPDGDTGTRRAWVGYERERLCRVAGPAYEDLVLRELGRLTDTIPRR